MGLFTKTHSGRRSGNGCIVEAGEALTGYKEKEHNCEDVNHWSKLFRGVLESVLGGF